MYRELSLAEKVKSFARKRGADIVGIASADRWQHAPLKLSPRGLLPEARAVVVIGGHVPDSCLETGGPPPWDKPGPAMAMGIAECIAAHSAFWAARFLEDQGYATLLISPTSAWRYRPYKDINTSWAPDLSHIHAAVAAGLGEFAWNSNFLSYEYGPRVRLVSIVTAAPLAADPLYSGPPLCDKCMMCAKVCPSGALTQELDGMAEIRIEDRVYQYVKKNKWRCGASDHFLIDVRKPWPEKIDADTVLSMEEKFGQHTWECSCYKICLPPHLRVRDARYHVPRRKKTLQPTSDHPLAPRLSWDELAQTAFADGMDFIAPASREKLAESGIDLEEHLPGARNAIILGVHYPGSIAGEAGRAGSQFSYFAKDTVNNQSAALEGALFQLAFTEQKIVKQLESHGWAALSNSDLDPDAVMDALGWEKPPGYSYTISISDAPLRATAPNRKSRAAEAARPARLCPADINEYIRRKAAEHGADVVGVSSRERMNDLVDALQEALPSDDYFTAMDRGPMHGKAKVCFEEASLEVKRPDYYLENPRSVLVCGIHFTHANLDMALQPPSEPVATSACAQMQTLAELRYLAYKLANELEQLGYRSFATCDLFGLASSIYNNRPFWGGRTGLYPDPTANSLPAVAAGLGELGMHGAALTPQFGARQRFIAIVTDAPLRQTPLYDGPSLCRQCGNCVQACPVAALSQDRIVAVKLENKTVRWAALDRLRCDWAKRYGLVGEAGPKYLGSQTDIMPPRQITRENLKEAMEQLDPLQKARISIVPRCLQACPCPAEPKHVPEKPHVRFDRLPAKRSQVTSTSEHR